jgi:hypothetical protein
MEVSYHSVSLLHLVTRFNLRVVMQISRGVSVGCSAIENNILHAVPAKSQRLIHAFLVDSVNVAFTNLSVGNEQRFSSTQH